MDMQMPVMDGVSATIELRKRPGLDKIPVIAMTANVSPKDRERCIGAGMNDFIAKPIDPDDLFEKLAIWLPPKAESAVVSLTVEEAEDKPWSLQGLAIPGLDIARGLRNVGNKQEFYVSLVKKFASKNREIPLEISAALDRDDQAHAERVAHTLKSVSGTIGADGVSRQAGRLEDALRSQESREKIDILLGELREKLAALLAEIAHAFPAANPPARSPDVSPSSPRPSSERSAALVGDMMKLLVAGNFAAVGVLNAERAHFDNMMGDRFPAFAKSIEELDFSGALDIIKVFAHGNNVGA